MELITVDRLGEHEDLPTRSELAGLRPGLFVKLALKEGQRFWAMLTTGMRENNTFAARVETAPVTLPEVKRGDLVILERAHILEII